MLTQSLDAPRYDGRMSTREERAYAYENTRAAQGERLRTLETLFDAGTIAELEARGVGRGWRCLEVGAGGGSIARWLADRVAPDGAVLATDLDTTVLEGLSHPNLEVRVHELEHDLPEGEFDLVHVRLVLAWLHDRRTALRRLIAALKPGGWLVAEDLDFASAVPDPHMGAELCARFTRIVKAHHAVIAERQPWLRPLLRPAPRRRPGRRRARGRGLPRPRLDVARRGAAAKIRASRSSSCATGSSTWS